ncbi:hypothetical protein F4781DRAFT_111512 [Annulohypoxylon bovei var. microspora]|nr:hypothetical protein F4781DRAFT_111512 [Annulohypoxylon bovei var. microspora]
MARLVQAPITQNRIISNPDALTDLNRLLARLQENILHADADRERRLRASEYERSKARVNIDYARSIVTKLEQDALAIKVHSRRQEVQADLNQKREILDQVAERFQELEDVSVDSEEDSSEGEDLLGDIIDTPSESVVSGEAADHQDVDDDEDDDGEEQEAEADEKADKSTLLPEQRVPDHLRPTATTTSSSQQATSTTGQTPGGTSTSQTLRPRGGATQPAPSSTATTDQASTTALRTELFGNRAASSPSAATATTEAIIDHHRSEQDKLTESMVGMARALKESSRAFASSLQEDTDVLQAAGQNLERNERGLGAVAGRMGALRRLTEGTGWWGRVLLYAWIAGLAVFAVLLVFVLPKLRF